MPLWEGAFGGRNARLAADEGDAAALHNLAAGYADGVWGLPKDEREAVRLFRLAADQGNAIA